LTVTVGSSTIAKSYHENDCDTANSQQLSGAFYFCRYCCLFLYTTYVKIEPRQLIYYLFYHEMSIRRPLSCNCAPIISSVYIFVYICVLHVLRSKNKSEKNKKADHTTPLRSLIICMSFITLLPLELVIQIEVRLYTIAPSNTDNLKYIPAKRI